MKKFIFLCILLLQIAVPARSDAGQTATGWQCRNDVEINCGSGKCAAETDFTPMSVSFDETGALSVCAYTGCWEGTGQISQTDDFLTIIGRDLKFSTAPDSAGATEDIFIALDRRDNIALLKAGSFAQPLICEAKR